MPGVDATALMVDDIVAYAEIGLIAWGGGCFGG